MQISLFHTISGRGPELGIDEYLADLEQFRSEGFGRVWSAQMPDAADTLTVFAAAGREVPDIELATGVLPIQPQHPMQLAQRALTVNALVHGRLTLGVGLTHQIVTEGMWGIGYDRPVRRAREFLDGLLPLLNGENVDAAGELTTTRGAVSFPETPAPPIYLAALGPQMLDLAGRRTAGTVTWMTGPKTLAGHIVPRLREAAQKAGRTDPVRTVAMLPVAVTDDVDGARTAASKAFRMYDSLPAYRAMLDREGYEHAWDAAIIGDEATVGQHLDELAEAGIDEFGAIVYDRDPAVRDRTRALLRSRFH
ncbi:TIGR03564 family F420-dependent LLM class oxidoreductase [Gordonia sp. VNK21]|uniref:TIGR03564 family F420-dependent LLM class oxidoreductase n=1 Tax=Gordonia sp. VNK21 TaxID=3382483 RepID=UPI0038D4DF04